MLCTPMTNLVCCCCLSLYVYCGPSSPPLPPAGAAVDTEHSCYAQVEASLEFLQERLEAAERAGAGEEERYQHTTAELHEQLEQQASELVECQHRIANLKEELEASRQRLEDEQHNEAELAKRAQLLEQEAAAAGRQLQQAGVDASGFPAAEVFVPAVAGAAGAEAAGAAQVADLTGAPSSSRVSRWAALLGSVDHDAQQQPAGLAGESSSSSTSSVLSLSPEQLSAQSQAEDAASAGASVVPSQAAHSGAPYEPMDMTAVTKHVEQMAAQYVEKLSIAEAELQVVRSVWQQAEDELAAMRSSPRSSSSDGSSRTGSPRATSPKSLSDAGSSQQEAQPGSPRLLAANGRVEPGDFELVRAAPPATAPHMVSGSAHSGAEAEHGTGERLALVVELPTPQFGGGHVGNFPEGYQKPASASRASSSEGQGSSDSYGSRSGDGSVSTPGSHRTVPVIAAGCEQ